MEGIGEQLRSAREAKHLTLSQAAGGTRIKIQHLESIEHDDFSNIAAAAYARGFIKIYAEFLGLDPEPLLRIYMERHAPVEMRPSLSGDEGHGPSRAKPRRAKPPPAEPDEKPAEPRGPPPAVRVAAQWLARVRPYAVPAAVGGAVLLVVILGLAFLIGRGGGAPATPLTEPLVIQEPPDPYLAVAAPEEDAP